MKTRHKTLPRYWLTSSCLLCPISMTNSGDLRGISIANKEDVTKARMSIARYMNIKYSEWSGGDARLRHLTMLGGAQDHPVLKPGFGSGGWKTIVSACALRYN